MKWQDEQKMLLDKYDVEDIPELTAFIKSLLKKQREEIEKEYNVGEHYEPYFGWCDVDGCKDEGCSGGNAWRESGYWTVCTKHSQDHRDGKPQPKMKQKAIDKENSRDPVTGYLPMENL